MQVGESGGSSQGVQGARAGESEVGGGGGKGGGVGGKDRVKGERALTDRIVAPLDPPVESCFEYVPEACQARRTAMGHELAFWFTSAFRMSDLIALT